MPGDRRSCRAFTISFILASMQEEKYHACISACYACATAAKQCAEECLAEKDPQLFAACVKLNQDCSTICLVAAIMMAGDSDFVKRTCELCAEICEACAAACEKHAQVAHCQSCIAACRKCAAECRAVSGSVSRAA
jgi:hypothetical protein